MDTVDRIRKTMKYLQYLRLLYLIPKFIILECIELPLMLISYPLAPIIVLFQKDGQLPKWLKWFQPYDNDLYGGNDWKIMHPPPKNQTWWIMTRYLWRNSIGTFSYKVTGVLAKLPILILNGDKKTQNRPYPGHSGILFVICRNSFMFYCVKQWGSSERCIRLLFGWKLMNLVDTGETKRTQLVFSFNPVMGFATKP